jgi:hypothetical protein
MMEFKGTKGDWVKLSLNYVYLKGIDICIADCEQDSTDIQNEANAKLIASAPDLLKELQKIKLDIDLGVIGVRKSSPIYSGIVNAINKALN